jgi:hypothetical protein
MFEPKEIVKTEKFRLILTGTMSMTSYPYSLEWFENNEGWSTLINLSPGDFAELIQLVKLYTEEK